MNRLAGEDGTGGLLGQAPGAGHRRRRPGRRRRGDRRRRSSGATCTSASGNWTTAGSYPEAVAARGRHRRGSAGGVFNRLDEDLARAIDPRRRPVRRARCAGAGDAFGGVAGGLGVLTALVLVGVARRHGPARSWSTDEARRRRRPPARRRWPSLAGLAAAGCTAPRRPAGAHAPVQPRPAGVQDPAVLPSASRPRRPPATRWPACARPAPCPPPGPDAGRLHDGQDRPARPAHRRASARTPTCSGYRDPRTGELVGFEIDLARRDRAGAVRRPDDGSSSAR